VRGEVALLFFAYNLKRVQNILGQQELSLFSFRGKMATDFA